MAFFKSHKYRGRKGFDLFGAYSFYIPGGTGLFWLTVTFMLGAILGNIVTLALAKFSTEIASQYGILFSYPLMFVPPMLFASVASRRNLMFEDGFALDSKNFGKYPSWLIALIVSVSTIALSFVGDIFNILLPPMPQWLEQSLKVLMDGPLWVSLVSVSIFAPFFEEWLCRGMILRGLLQKMNPRWAIVISALFFALIHMNPWQALPAFAFGCLFGYVYYKTGSLKLTMLMHCVNNTLATLLTKVPRLENAESFMDIMSPWAYWLEFVACICVVVAAVAAISVIKLPEGERSGCERIKFDE